jgi:hypothetical protein
MQKMFLLVAGLACACAPSQGFAQSKMEKPNTVSSGAASMGRIDPSSMGKQNLPHLQSSAKPTGKMATENPGGLQSGVKPGKLDGPTAGMQGSAKTIGKLDRENPGTLQLSATPTKFNQGRTKASTLDGARSTTDSVQETSETESMRLQMVMDRKSKMLEAVSNIQKKKSQTDDQVIKNMK